MDLTKFGEFMKLGFEAKSSKDLDQIRKLRNLMHDCTRDNLRSIIEALHAPIGSRGKTHNVDEKSALKSKEFRKNGNGIFAKTKHSAIDHKMILHLYTKSIAYAPQNSEELAFAYSNRSVLWFHVQRYDLSLADIGRALQITGCNDTLRVKLFLRQEKCLNLLQNDKNDRKILKLPGSELLSCTAESIALAYNEKYGRHYIATRDIRPGEVILSEKSPYIAVKHHQVYLVCSHCLAFAWASIPCNYCVYTVYCNETCKEEAWKLYHDTMCPKLRILQATVDIDPDEDLHDILSIATRILDISTKREGIETVLKEAERIDKGEGPRKDSSIQQESLDCEKFKMLYSLANGKIVDKMERTSPFTIRDKLTYIKNANCFEFVAVPLGSGNESDSCECKNLETCLAKNCTKRGSIIGPCSSLVNHSCIPNVAEIFLPGPRIVMVTVKPVKKGEQLFVSYGPRADNLYTESRQENLRMNYLFNCDCLACKKRWPDKHPDRAYTASKQSMINRQLLKTFGCHTEMIQKPAKSWYYSEDLLEAAVKMCEFIYRRFDEWEALLLSGSYKNYIRQCFSYLYGEHANEFLHGC